jgi:thousand and one amino acid protein kinase
VCWLQIQEQQKEVIKTLKDEKRRKLVLLGEQYDQSITEMLQKQTVRLDESQMVCIHIIRIF